MLTFDNFCLAITSFFLQKCMKMCYFLCIYLAWIQVLICDFRLSYERSFAMLTQNSGIVVALKYEKNSTKFLLKGKNFLAYR